MRHDARILKHEDRIAGNRDNLPDWIRRLERPAAPVLMPKFGPLEGIRAVGTGVLVAQPYLGTKLAEFGAEVIHVERPDGDTFRFIAPLLTLCPREHGCDEAEVGKNKLSMGIDLTKPARRRVSDGAVEDFRYLDGVIRARHA
jgi:crotonobetainyl-CoA:carnitine CoA-transferase CaiB-like acyl-CoA transferase